MKRAKTPLIMTCVLIPVAVILRVISVVRYSISVTDWFSLAVAGLLVLFTVLLLLASLNKKQQPARPCNERAIAISVLCIFSGAALVIGNMADAINWLTTGVTPPPVNYSVRSADTLLLVLLLFFGILGGLYWIHSGLLWLRQKACVVQKQSWPALFPVLWSWFRLARYAVSYVSATGLGDTIYDYGYLIFSLLFTMLLAHFMVGSRPIRQSNWIAVALPTALFGLVGSLGTFVLAVLPSESLQREIHAGNMAGWVDLLLSVLALFMASDALLGQPQAAAAQPAAPISTPLPAEEPTTEESPLPSPEASPAQEAAADVCAEAAKVPQEKALPSLEELLNEFSSNKAE